MSFVNKFRPAGNNPPPGVKMEHTSFGYAQNQKPYTMPQLPKQTAPTQKIQPRGGWDEDDDDEPQVRVGSGQNRGGNQFQNQVNAKKPFAQSPLTPSSAKADELSLGPSKKVNPAKDFEIMQITDSFLSSHEFENKTINDLIQPGGARIKQADSALNTFCKACESFQVPVVGSLLMSKLYEEIPFISKARTLYLIETLVKRVKKYFDYVKYNLNILQGADYSSDASADQLRKITNDIAQYIEEPNKPKQPVIPQTTYNTTIPQTNNLLGADNDLLGASPQAKTTNKPDPFAFVKKQSPEVVQSQPPQSRPAPVQQNNAQLLDLDFGSQPAQQSQQSFVPQSQPFSQPQPQSQPQSQGQAKKFNPFEIPSGGQNKPQPVSENLNQNVSKPAGSGLNFKKFQGQGQTNATPAPVQQQFNTSPNKTVTPVSQKANNMDDLLGSFSSLDFSSNNTTQPVQPAQVTQPNSSSPSGFPFQSSNSPVQTTNSFNKATPAPINTQTTFPGGFGNPSFGSNQPNMPSQGFNTGFNNPMSTPPSNQGFPSYGNMGPGPSSYGQNSFSGYGYGHGPSGGFNNNPGWNAGGYGGFNGPMGSGFNNYGQGNYPSGNFNQGQGYNYSGNASNFQNQNSMGGIGSFQNQSNMQGMNAYYGGIDELLSSSSPGLHNSEEVAAKQEQAKKNQQKQKNEALFDSLKF